MNIYRITYARGELLLNDTVVAETEEAARFKFLSVMGNRLGLEAISIPKLAQNHSLIRIIEVSGALR